MTNPPSSKRSHGEGTEVRRGDDGRWHAFLSMGVKSGGQRDRRHVSGRSRAEVARKLRALQAQRDAGVVPDAGRSPTVSAWLDHWLDNIAVHKVRPKTLQGYRGMVRHRIAPALGHHRLDRLQPEHVEAFYAAMRAEGVLPTALQCHRILSRALKVAMQRGKVSRNVCTLATHRPSPAPRPGRSPPPKRGRCSTRPPARETPPGGQWRSASACAKGKRWGSPGTRLTSTPECSRSAAPYSGSAGRGWSWWSRSPAPGGAASRSRPRWWRG